MRDREEMSPVPNVILSEAKELLFSCLYLVSKALSCFWTEPDSSLKTRARVQ